MFNSSKMKTSILFISVLLFLIGCVVDEDNETIEEDIIFTWDKDPFDDRLGTVTETVNGITVTVTSPLSNHKHSVGFIDIENIFINAQNNSVVGYHLETSITFTFSKPVYVKSIVAMSSENQHITYTFSTLEDGNAPFAKNLIPGRNVAKAIVEFDWTRITSFTVTSSETLFGFDNLIVTVPNVSTGL